MRVWHEAQATTTVPDWLLERYALGELPADRAADVKRRLETEPGGAERLAALQRSNEEILLQHPPRAVVPAIERKAGRSKRTTTWFVGLPLVLAATAAFLLTSRSTTDDVSGIAVETGIDTTRTKGSAPILRIYRKGAQDAEELQPGAKVHARDLLQAVDVAASLALGGPIGGAAAVNDRALHASDVLAALD